MDNWRNKEYNVRNKPAFCCLVITDRCMLECKMCYKWKKTATHLASCEPGIEDWKRFIASLRRFVKGEFCINFAGGEPLISNKTLELIEYASGAGFDTLLTTNGFLIDEDMAKKINNSGLKHIFISLDSLNEATHDFIRGVRGTHQRAMKAIEYLYQHNKNLRLKIATIIMEKNLGELLSLARWVIEDERVCSINFQAITHPLGTVFDDEWYNKAEYNFLWPKDFKKVQYALGELIELKRESQKIDNPVSQFKIFKSYFENPREFFIKNVGCHSQIYKRSVNVNSSGQVYICFDMESIGNIKEDDFDVEKLWYSPRGDLSRNSIKNCRKNCESMVNCNYDENYNEQECYIN